MSEEQNQGAGPEQPTGGTQAPGMPEAAGEEARPAPSKDDINLALLCHLLAIILPIIAPLIIWLMKKDQSQFVDHHGKEALNFAITWIVVGTIAGIVTCWLFFLGLFIVWLLALVFHILATMAASKGEWYRYPLSVRLIK